MPRGPIRGVKRGPYNVARRKCPFRDCTGKHYARGYCARHYHRLYHDGAFVVGAESDEPTTAEEAEIRMRLAELRK